MRTCLQRYKKYSFQTLMKMNRNHLNLKKALIAVLLFITFSCQQDSDSMDGTLIGFVDLINTKGEEVLDKSGAVVTSIESERSAITDDLGKFEINKLPIGTHRFKYELENYSNYETGTYTFAGGDVPGILSHTTLYEIPKLDVESINIEQNSNQLYITLEFTEPVAAEVSLFMGLSQEVSIDNNQYKRTFQWICCDRTNTTFSVNLDNANFFPGQTIYMSFSVANSHEPFRFNEDVTESFKYSDRPFGEVVTYVYQ